MKKNIIILSICAATLMLASCGKDNKVQNIDRFHVNFAGFSNGTNTKLTIPDDDYSTMIYDDGDILYVNNVPFVLTQDGDDWVANRMSGSGTLEGDDFYCLYFDPDYCKKNSWAAGMHAYKVTTGTSAGSVNGMSAYNTGIVLQGRTADTVVTMRPICAILRFETYSVNEAAGMYVGFNNDIAVKSTVFTPDYVTGAPTFNNTSYYPGINYSTSGITGDVTVSGQVLKATDKNTENLSEECVYHVVVPLIEETSSDLFFVMYNGSNYYYKKVEDFPLTPGYIYTFEW